jgi:lysophospholipase L1-like esterase
VHERLPQTAIAYISIAGNPARWAQVEKVKAANAMIEAFARETPGLKFINVFPQMLGPDGQPRPEIFSADRLHMNEEGYKLWAKIVRPFLE